MNNAPNNTNAHGNPPMIRMGPRRGGGPMAGRMNAEKPKNTLPTLKRLLRYIGKSSVILIALLAIGIRALIKHFKHESSCCGGGSQTTAVPEKKLDRVIGTKPSGWTA